MFHLKKKIHENHKEENGLSVLMCYFDVLYKKEHDKLYSRSKDCFVKISTQYKQRKEIKINWLKRHAGKHRCQFMVINKATNKKKTSLTKRAISNICIKVLYIVFFSLATVFFYSLLFHLFLCDCEIEITV